MSSNLKKVSDIYFNLFDLMMTYNHRIWRTVSMPLSLNHFVVLCFLDFNGTSTITDIATHLAISKQQMSTIVDKLLKQELIERKCMTNDRRYSQISISSKGKKFMEEHRKEQKLSLINQIVDLSDEEAKRFDESAKVLKHMINKMFKEK